MHAINCFMLPLQVLKHVVMYRKQKQQRECSTKKDPHAKRNKTLVTQLLREFVMKYILNPILVGIILYGRETLGGLETSLGIGYDNQTINTTRCDNTTRFEDTTKGFGGDNDYGVRVCIAFALINTSYLYLGSIGTLPLIGSFTNMISKVDYLKNYIEYCHM